MLKPTIYYGKYHRSTIDCITSNNKLILTEYIKLLQYVQCSLTPFQLLKFHELQLFKFLRLPIKDAASKTCKYVGGAQLFRLCVVILTTRSWYHFYIVFWTKETFSETSDDLRAIFEAPRTNFFQLFVEVYSIHAHCDEEF